MDKENGTMADTENNKNQQPVEEIIGTTVLIEKGYEGDNFNALGNGFFIEPDKIVTNVHVLAGAATVTAKCGDTEAVYTVEGIIAFDDINDLAVLKIAEEDTPFPLSDSRRVRKGDQVCLIGCLEEKAKHVEGTVDSIRNSGKHLWLEFKHSAGPGYSGGPVLNAKGEVVAVAQSGDTQIVKNKPIKGKTISSNVLKLLLKETKEVESLDAWQKRPRICAYVKSYNGYLSREHGNIKEAIALYDDALILNPDLADIYKERASAKESLGKRDESLVDSLKVLQLNRERFSFSRLGIFLSWKWKVVKLSSVCRFQKLIRNIFGEGNWFEIQAQVKFRLAKMKFTKGKISETLNLYQAGVDDCTEAINHKPIETKQRNLYTARKLYQEAIGDFTEAINRKPKRAKSYYNRGRAKHIFGQFENQQENFEKAQKLFHGAINDFTETINLKLGGLYTHNHLGQTKYLLAKLETKQGNTEVAQNLYQEIVSDSNEALQLKVKCVACRTAIHYTCGAAKAALDDHEGAIEDFNNAIKLKPKKALYYHDRDLSKEALGQHEEAEADFAKAKELVDSDFEK